MRFFQQMRYSVIFRRAGAATGLYAACIFLALGLARCGNEQIDLKPLEAVVCDTTAASYAVDIQPVVQTNCLDRRCHNSQEPNAGHPADALWDNFSALQRYALEENLLAKIEGTHTSGSRMPLGGPPLTECEIEAFRSWIEQGAPQN